jgi:FkbM family methyltransferase
VERSLERFLEVAGRYCELVTISSVFELGARDGAETVAFRRLLPGAMIYSFECNPATLPLCRAAVEGLSGVRLVEKAVSERNGTAVFYAIDPERTSTSWSDGNPGASSLFQASGKYPEEDYVQDQTTVETVRLDSFLEEIGLTGIDLLWMDIQGAELLALQGLGSKLSTVKLIHLEAEFVEIYEGQPLFSDLKRFLNARGFLLQSFTTMGRYSADAVFVNSGLLSTKQALRARLGDRTLPALASAERRARTVAGNRIVRGLRGMQRQAGRDPVLALRRVLAFAWLAGGKRLLALDVNLRRGKPSSGVPLDVVIPACEEDAHLLPLAIESLRQFLMHPIGDVYVVAPPSPILEGVCASLGVLLVDESEATRLPRRRVRYQVGEVDRSGWLLQQFIKLSADQIVRTDAFLVMDADTILVRPQVFEHRGRFIVNHSDEYHRPYFDAYERLLGERPKSVLSFVSHGMVFTAATLRQLRAELEARHATSWEEAILGVLDFAETSNFSEYELYGNFCLARKVPMTRAYWFNIALPRRRLQPLAELVSRWGDHKTVSFHGYLE